MVYQPLSLSHTTRRSYDGALYGLKYVGCAPSNVSYVDTWAYVRLWPTTMRPSRHSSNVAYVRFAYLPVWPCHMVGQRTRYAGPRSQVPY